MSARGMFCRCLPLIAALIFSLSTAHIVHAGEWVSMGPDGATVRCLVQDPENAEIMYVGIHGGGMGAYKSTDSGVSWNPIPGLPSTIWTLIFDPADQELLFAGSYLGIFSSRDGGATWNLLGSGLFRESVNSISIPVSAQELILAGTRTGVFRSTDGGRTWSTSSEGLPESTVISVLACPSSTPQVLYAGTWNDGVFKSTDGGSSWNEASSGLPGGDVVYCLVIDPGDPETLFVGTSQDGVYRSSDGATTWVSVGSDFSDLTVEALAITPGPGKKIFAGTLGAIRVSSDNGVTWAFRNLGEPVGDITVIYPGIEDDALVLAGSTAVGVFRSTDRGVSWRVSNSGLNGTQVFSQVFSPCSSNTLLVGTRGGIYRSTDRGLSWLSASKGLGAGVVSSIIVDPSDCDFVYAGGPVGLYRSEDGGISWAVADSGIESRYKARALAVGGAHYAVVLAGTDDGVFRSTDRATSWSAADAGISGVSIERLAVSPSIPDRVYAGTHDGCIFRSDDCGLSWTPAGIGLSSQRVKALAVSPVDPDVAFAAISTQVFRTRDGGTTWEDAGGDLPPQSIYALVFDPTQPELLYVGGSRGAFTTKDEGLSWSSLGRWNTAIWVESLAIDPLDGRMVSAGTYGASLRVYSLVGRSLWVPVVTHNAGVNDSLWRSDVWVLNPGSEEGSVTLRFHGPSRIIEAKYDLAAGSQIAFEDVVDLLGGAGSGALEIIGSTEIFAASRSYNLSDEGSFGQSFTVGDAATALEAGEEALLGQLAENADFRTNIGFVNTSQEAAVAQLELFDERGLMRAEATIKLEPGEWHLELRPYQNLAGLTDVSAGWARVKVEEGGGILALASIIDNATGDPAGILMVRPSRTGGRPVWIPVTAHAPGLHESLWRSDVAILNSGLEPAVVNLSLHASEVPATYELNLSPGESKLLGDVVDLVEASGAGTLEIMSSEPLAVSSRTYNQSDAGSFGQSFAGIRPEEGLSIRKSGWLPGLSENERYRTNIGFANLADTRAVVELELFMGDGTRVADYSVALDPWEWHLELQPFLVSAGLNDLGQGYARVEVSSGESVVVLASVVDNRSNDPTTVVLVR